jgi:uncharacterized protein (DUF2236 family)
VSVSHTINAERIVLIGWSRAILLQMAHPLIAAGVADHSTFEGSPVATARRLRHTVRAMLGLTFGTAAEHAKTIAGILAIHRRVNGTLRQAVGTFPAGTRYSAEDPALVLWVHATLIESVVLAYEALVAPLSAAARDAYCREAAPVAVELGARAEDVPRDWNTLRRYLAGMLDSGAISVGPDGRNIARALLRGRYSRLTGPAAWANRLVTTGWLPARIRAEYGLEWNDGRARQFARTIAVLRRVRKLTPAFLAHWSEARAAPPTA